MFEQRKSWGEARAVQTKEEPSCSRLSPTDGSTSVGDRGLQEIGDRGLQEIGDRGLQKRTDLPSDFQRGLLSRPCVGNRWEIRPSLG